MNRKAGVGCGLFITLSLLLIAFDSMCGALCLRWGLPALMGRPWVTGHWGSWSPYCSLGSALGCGLGQVGLLSLWEQIQNGVGIALQHSTKIVNEVFL